MNLNVLVAAWMGFVIGVLVTLWFNMRSNERKRAKGEHTCTF
jgi:hypothetical protein